MYSGVYLVSLVVGVEELDSGPYISQRCAGAPLVACLQELVLTYVVEIVPLAHFGLGAGEVVLMALGESLPACLAEVVDGGGYAFTAGCSLKFSEILLGFLNIVFCCGIELTEGNDVAFEIYAKLFDKAEIGYTGGVHVAFAVSCYHSLKSVLDGLRSGGGVEALLGKLGDERHHFVLEKGVELGFGAFGAFADVAELEVVVNGPVEVGAVGLVDADGEFAVGHYGLDPVVLEFVMVGEPECGSVEAVGHPLIDKFCLLPVMVGGLVAGEVLADGVA